MASPTSRLVGTMTTTTKGSSTGMTSNVSTKSGLPKFLSSHLVTVSTILPLMKKGTILISKESSRQATHTSAFQKPHLNKSNIISCVNTPLWSAVIETDGASVTSKMQNASGFIILK